MDLITRLFGRNIEFYEIYSFTPNLFTLIWIFLFIGLTLSFKKKIGKKIYLIINILFLSMFLVNNVYYSMTKTFFDFNLLESTSEGVPYIIDTILNCNIWVYISTILIIISIIIGYKKIPYKTKNNKPLFLITIILFLILHTIAPHTLGKANSELTEDEIIIKEGHISNGYHYMSGTSMAAPHVTGVAALLLSINPNLTAAQLKTAIMNGVDDNHTISTPDGNQSVKKLNAYKAVKYVLDNYGNNITLNSKRGHFFS